MGSGTSEKIGVILAFHQGSVLSLLIFIIESEALSKELRTCCHWKQLYANDFMISAEFSYVPLHHSFIRDYLPWLEGRVDRSHDE